MTERMDAELSQLTKHAVLDLIGALFPWIAEFRQQDLADYARAVFDVEPHARSCEARRHAMSHFRRCIRRAARTAGFADHRANAIAAEIANAPVMQAGPHLHLLVEPDAYYTHLFSLMGLSAHRRSAYVSYAVSTVKFVERGRKGPGWLKLGGEAINVFGLSRSRMIPYSILAQNGPYRFALKNVDRAGRDGDLVARLRSILPQCEFASAAVAIKQANAELWSRYFDPDIDFLQIDDEDVADLVVEHLQDKLSWLARNLFEKTGFLQSVLSSIEALAGGNWQGWLKNTTDLFWGSDRGRLFPLRLAGSRLEARGSEDFSLEFVADAVIEALQARKIIPNLLLMLIVTAILPGVRVLGGSRHIVYYPLMRYVFCRGLDMNEDRELSETIAADRNPGIWGHRVLLENAEPFSELDMLGSGNIRAALRKYGRLSLEGACGTLESFAGDSLWASLKARHNEGAVAVNDPEWAFS
ncbi:hypothetical protein RHSP_06628 [Rhizobium freirei PRF 81]|uniref:Uncharacterized protein n=1 Tax=Rhizobium freirei PRF 81 TaxID=363754 RepID=N6V3G2_9HYPH|nr:hypothetical protein [Rhizobium freirei]ENN85577.1 hypothetical protein RHSP_06628 [Rhizobium freirei PRF 81]